MTIRYQCTECESVLKIRDDKAGQTARCPKCKTEFVIPEPEAAPAEDETQTALAADDDPGEDSEDDAMAFLMESGDVPVAPPSAATSLEDDDDDAPPPPRPSPDERQLHRPPPRPKADSEDTSSAAGALLAAGESARSAAANESEPVEERPRVDMDEVKQLATRKLLPIGGGIVVICGIFFYQFNSMSGGANLPPLASVSGTITLDGKPLANATVFFDPVTDMKNAEQRQMGSSIGRSDDQGVYNLAYPGGHSGAVIGMHIVRVNKTDKNGLEILAKKYHRQSQMKHEVKDGSNTIDLPLRSEPTAAAGGKRTADPPSP